MIRKGLIMGMVALLVGTGSMVVGSEDINEPSNMKKIKIFATLDGDIYSTNGLPNDGVELQFVSEYLVWGSHNDVTVVDGIAYVANDLGLLLIDISEPSRPRLVSKYISDDFQNWGIYVDGQYAYLTNRYNGMDIVDVSVPNNPVFLGNWGYGLMPYSYSVWVKDSVAYLASLVYGLVIIDVTNPVTPTKLTTYPFVNCADVAVQDDFAYVVGDGKLLVLDVSNPATPESVGACETPGSARRLCLSGDGNYVYVADGDAGLTIVDVSSPSLPEVCGGVATYDFGWDVWIVGRYAYVADREAGLTIVDVEDPQHPTVVGNCVTPGEDIHFQGVFAGSHYAYLADDDAGLEIIDISLPTNPMLVGSFGTSGLNGATEVAIHDSCAYLIDRSDGLKILDISEAYAPRLVGVFEDDRSRGLSLNYPYAYVASENTDLMVIDVSDSTNPCLIGTYDTPIGAQDVYTVDTITYLVGGNQLFVINVTSPYNPSLMGSVELNTSGDPRIVRDIYVKDSYAYIVCNDTAEIFSGVTIVDISAPYAPQVVSEYAVDYFAFSVWVHESKAYIGEGMICEPDAPGRLEIINVADPENPFYLGEYNIPDGIVLGIYVDSVAYLASGAAGIKVLDVSEPDNPELICEYNTPGVACGLFVNVPYVYVGDHYSFIILTTGPLVIRGDCNNDGIIDLGDVVHLISYLYRGGPPPEPFEAGDVNCDGVIDLGDVVYLINYLYQDGPPPSC